MTQVIVEIPADIKLRKERGSWRAILQFLSNNIQYISIAFIYLMKVILGVRGNFESGLSFKSNDYAGDTMVAYREQWMTMSIFSILSIG